MEANKNIDKAKQDYMNGMKYKDIAKKYNVSLSTVKSWKTRYKWSRNKSVHTDEKSTRTKSKSMHTKKDEAVEDNSKGLSPEDEYYCYLRATQRIPKYKAYLISRKGLNIKDSTAMINSTRLEKKENITERIAKIQQESLKKNGWTFDNTLKQLDMLFEQAVSSIFEKGLNKANSDAAFNAIDRITNLLSIVPSEQAKLKKLQMETRLRELQVKTLDSDNDSQMSQLSELFDKFEGK